MNIFVKEKEMPSLNTRTHLAIIGTTANWCPVSLQKTLHKDLERHMDKLQTNGRVDTKFFHHGVPASRLLAPEEQDADAQDELPHEQAGC